MSPFVRGVGRFQLRRDLSNRFSKIKFALLVSTLFFNMEPKLMLLIAFASTFAIIQACTASESFVKNEIVPDVVDTSPMHLLEVRT